MKNRKDYVNILRAVSGTILIIVIICSFFACMAEKKEPDSTEPKTAQHIDNSHDEKTPIEDTYEWYVENGCGTETDLDLLARLVYAEAGNQDYLCQMTVAQVVLNRVKSKHYPNTIKEVIYECNDGEYQFTPVRSGSIINQPTKECFEVAKAILDGQTVCSSDVIAFESDKRGKLHASWSDYVFTRDDMDFYKAR